MSYFKDDDDPRLALAGWASFLYSAGLWQEADAAEALSQKLGAVTREAAGGEG